MADQYHKSIFTGRQIDEGIGRILNGEIDAAVGNAAAYASKAKEHANTAGTYAGNAEEAAQRSKTHADRAEAARDSILLDEAKMGQFVQQATEQADRSGDFAIQAGVDADRSEREADRAQAEADRATLPPVQGVYNIVIPDRITGMRYKLIVEDGVLGILSVSAKLDAVEPVQIDPITGIAWRIIVEDGALGIEEVS